MKLDEMDLIQLTELYIAKSKKAEQLEKEADEVARRILDWADKYPFEGVQLGHEVMYVDLSTRTLRIESDGLS